MGELAKGVHFNNLILSLDNESPIGFFRSSRGLRQGDPLSLYPSSLGWKHSRCL